jgi:hypothetical protein
VGVLGLARAPGSGCTERDVCFGHEPQAAKPRKRIFEQKHASKTLTNKVMSFRAGTAYAAAWHPIELRDPPSLP